MNLLKRQLKNYYLSLRSKLDSQLKEQKNIKIFNNIKNYLRNNLFKRKIAIYFSLENEVDTKRIINWLLNKNYEVYLPKIIDINKSIMEFVKIGSLSDKEFEEVNIYNIKQPISNEYVNPELLDIIFVPLVSFDKNRNRLGMGKGFYDIYLKRTFAKKIGLAYQIQQHYLLPVNKNDVKLDLIFTENGVN